MSVSVQPASSRTSASTATRAGSRYAPGSSRTARALHEGLLRRSLQGLSYPRLSSGRPCGVDVAKTATPPAYRLPPAAWVRNPFHHTCILPAAEAFPPPAAT
jgi:hypothetical protein